MTINYTFVGVPASRGASAIAYLRNSGTFQAIEAGLQAGNIQNVTIVIGSGTAGSTVVQGSVRAYPETTVQSASDAIQINLNTDGVAGIRQLNGDVAVLPIELLRVRLQNPAL